MANTKDFIERQIYKETKNHLKYKEITVITGMRRVGKTTIISKLLEDVDGNNKAYFDKCQAYFFSMASVALADSL